MTNFSVVYYSNGRLPEPLKWFCIRTLSEAVAASGGELICVTWEPLEFANSRNIVWPRHVFKHENIYEQILAGISEVHSDSVALAEHDVLYPAGYHEALLSSAGATACFNTNVWRLNNRGFFRDGNSRLLSNYGGRRGFVRARIEEKLSEVRRSGRISRAEPDGDGTDAPLPTIDIRHGMNWTGDREPPDGAYSETVEFWGSCRAYTRLFTSCSETASTTPRDTPAASPNRSSIP